MPLISDHAVVLRRLDYSETSQVLVVLTREHGKARAIAKGIKRSTKTRFAAAIDLLDVGRLVLSRRPGGGDELAILTEWKQTLVFSGLRQTLPRLHAAQYAAEVVTALTEDWDPHRGVYDGVIELFEQASALDDPLPALVAFVSRLLTEVGLTPRFDACVSCGKASGQCSRERDVHFSSLEGGLLCRDCEAARVEKRRVEPAALALLGGGGAASAGAWRAAFDLLNYHISHLTGRRPLLADKLLPAGRHLRQRRS